MLLLRTHTVIEVSVPVEVSVIVVLSVITYLYPWTVRMLGHVVPALIELLQSAILLSEAEDVLGTVGRVVHELVHDHYMVISCPYEVCRSGVCLPSEASVVLYACIVAALTCLCGDEHDSGRCLRTIDCTCGSILEH